MFRNVYCVRWNGETDNKGHWVDHQVVFHSLKYLLELFF